MQTGQQFNTCMAIQTIQSIIMHKLLKVILTANHTEKIIDY